MQLIKGGITAPEGFLASAVSCGIKKSGRADLALLFSEVPCVCAGAFTTNSFKSGSCVLTQMRVKKGLHQAVMVNSGNANSCVGKKEIQDAKELTSTVAKNLGLGKEKVLIASTGIIGRPLPIGKIKNKVPLLVKSLKRDGRDFAKAIMTTDTLHKEVAVRLNLGGKWIKIAGAAKGSGMINPCMATMLAFFTTDAAIEKNALTKAFKDAVDGSFNKIIVDGDMSTNDTSLIFANGLAGGRIIKKGSANYFKFLNGLGFVAKELARKIVLDGEGATKFVEILVKAAKTNTLAEKVARHLATSSLVKTMIAGGDPNWGRVAASIGSSGVGLNKGSVDIYFGKRLVMKNGVASGVPRYALIGIFKKGQIKITVDLKSGKGSCKIWTCDLTEGYVRINSEYET